MPDGEQEQVKRLFAAYRAALPDPEPSPEFMPRLWLKIDARQNQTIGFRRMAQALITAAAAVSLLMGAWIVREPAKSSFYANSYLELLAASDNNDGLGDAEIIIRQQQDRLR